MSPGGRCRQKNYGLNAEPLGHGDKGRGPTRAGSQDWSVCVCVYVRDAICSQLLLTIGVRLPRVQSGAPHPQLFWCLRGGVSAALSAKMVGGCKAEHLLSGGYRAEIWAGVSAVRLQTSVLRGSTQARQGLGTFASCSKVHVFCPLGLSGVRCPLSAAFSCSVTASSLFSSLPHPHHHSLESTVAPWPG